MLRLKTWQTITTDQWVLQVVKGYKLELMSTPLQRSQPLTVVAKDDQTLVTEEVLKLLDKGAINVINPCPDQFVSRIFLVPKKDSSFRPVINLKPLNQFMTTTHFKMESLAMLRNLLRPGDWVASIDLKDAYLSVAIWEEHRKYLQFAWSSKLYEFQCLPFGLCITKLLKPVQSHLLHQGVRLVMHLDNMLVIAQRREELEGQLQQITSLLETLGFVVNQENSQLATSQTIQYLGFLIDSREMKSG